jgi:hypothetical protein
MSSAAEFAITVVEFAATNTIVAVLLIAAAMHVLATLRAYDRSFVVPKMQRV